MSTKIAIIGSSDKSRNYDMIFGQKNFELFNEFMTEEAIKELSFNLNRSPEPIPYIAQKFEVLADLSPVVGKSRKPFSKQQKKIRNKKKRLSKLNRKHNRK